MTAAFSSAIAALFALSSAAMDPTAPSSAAPSAAVPSPAAATSAAPVAAGVEHLKEIGHVRALTSFCRGVLEKTDHGVAILLENDREIGNIQSTLRTSDFDRSELTRWAAINKLTQQETEMRAAAVTGNGIMALLREQLKDSPTPEQRAALLSFEEAIDGALMRQKRLADRIARMWVILSNHPRIDEWDRREMEIDALRNENNALTYHDPEGPLANLPDSLDTTAKYGADDIQTHEEEILHDEDDAADRMDAAFAGCL